MSKTLKIVLGAALVVVLLGGGGLWYFVLRDTAEKTASLDTIGSGSTGTSTGPAKATADGAWKIQQDETVFAGYRIQELFAGATLKKTATGRSPDVSGTMTIAGTSISGVEVKVNTTKLKSDDDRRDSQIRKKGIATADFPEATFKMTKPLTLPSAPKQNEEVSATVSGELTLHGVTKSVEVPLKASWKGSTIVVATVGEGLPITLADYQIEPVEIPGFVKVDEQGTLELQLLFVPA
jgi:polyisoprenoid-binding protein YceI